MKYKMEKLIIRCPKCGNFHTEVEFDKIIKLGWTCERCKTNNYKVLIAKNFEKC